MTGLYCRGREEKSEGRKNANNESAPSGTEEGGGTGGSDFGGERGDVEKQHDHCRSVCRRELHLNPCS